MELLYQDSQIVLCVKPAGLSSEAGAGSLPEFLEDQLGRPVFPVHRLDRNVGGVMVYARTRQAASALSQAVQAGNLQKEYLALIHGCPTQPAGTWEDLLWKDSAKNKVFVVRRMRKGGQSGQARLPGAGGGHSSDPGAHPLVYRPEPPDPGAICQPGLPSGRRPQVRQPG